MLRLILCIVLLFFLSSTSYGLVVQPVAYPHSFSWNANVGDGAVGYRLYFSAVPGEYDQSKMVADIKGIGTTTIEIDVAEGTWYSVLTAYNINQVESGYSNEARFISGPPGIPQEFKHIINITININ